MDSTSLECVSSTTTAMSCPLQDHVPSLQTFSAAIVVKSVFVVPSVQRAVCESVKNSSTALNPDRSSPGLCFRSLLRRGRSRRWFSFQTVQISLRAFIVLMWPSLLWRKFSGCLGPLMLGPLVRDDSSVSSRRMEIGAHDVSNIMHLATTVWVMRGLPLTFHD